MNALEQVQYQASQAVSGTWQGTSRSKIYEELGWETLDHRRYFRRLVQFYKKIYPKPRFLGHFSEKSGSVTFDPLWTPNFMQKIRKN